MSAIQGEHFVSLGTLPMIEALHRLHDGGRLRL
jgi:hypothetical protein